MRVHAVAARYRVSSLNDLQLLVANHLSVCLEYIRSDEDVERIGRERSTFSPALARVLRAEFLTGDTEGLLLAHPSPGPGALCYLAVIDCRGERALRSYFTVWHELSHLLLLPPQLVFDGFRRSPAPEMRQKDPLESVVDDVAGLVGFFEPLYGPAVDAARLSAAAALGLDGAPLTLGAIEEARRQVAPGASFLASAIAAVRRASEPLALVCAKHDWKPTERRQMRHSGRAIPPSLRLRDVVCNATARGLIRLHRHLRVPAESVVSQVFHEMSSERVGLEDQSWWETSASGALEPLPVRVHAERRGPVVYALVAPLAIRAAVR
jgi:hypothetical protein